MGDAVVVGHTQRLGEGEQQLHGPLRLPAELRHALGEGNADVSPEDDDGRSACQIEAPEGLDGWLRPVGIFKSQATLQATPTICAKIVDWR